MIKNYFKIAWRNLWKNKIFSLINISGLAIGLISFLLIALYVGDELSYDRFHKNADRIVRVVQHARWGSNDPQGAGSVDDRYSSLAVQSLRAALMNPVRALRSE